MRGLLLAPLAVLAVATVACTAPATSGSGGDVGDETQGSTTSHVSKGCSASRESLIAAAGAKRGAVIERGLEWWDAKVPYSQQGSHEGYRTDCSGFVSMCWSLPQSFTTADFAAGTANNSILGSYEDLQPGDGLVRRSGGSGHAVLFVGWDDDAHTEACVLEEASSATDMQFGVRTVASLESQGFNAMRADGMPDAEPAAADDGDKGGAADEPAAEDEPAADEPAADDPVVPTTPPVAGDACTNDEACNPRLGGTGLVCNAKQGKCVAGCRYDLHCPGKQLCKAGACSM